MRWSQIIRSSKIIFKHALNEYLANGFFIFIAYFIYTNHSYYLGLLQPLAQEIIQWVIWGYVILAFPYFLIRNLIYHKIYLRQRAKAILVLRYLKILAERIYTLPTLPSTLRNSSEKLLIKPDKKTKTAILSIIVKFFYFPLMLSFLVHNYQIAKTQLNNIPKMVSMEHFIFDWGYFFIYNLIFIIDTAVFAFAYAFEAKWMRNEIKSVDPYLSGWTVALISYPPFNGAADKLLSFGSNNAAEIAFFAQFRVQIVIRSLIILLYLIYLWATIALFTKASNLTNRGIVTSGPYRYIRHPAYVSKNLAWWLERLPSLTSWVTLLPLIGWNIIYVLRALTEERHLLADPDYRKYVKKVPQRFIPKLF